MTLAGVLSLAHCVEEGPRSRVEVPSPFAWSNDPMAPDSKAAAPGAHHQTNPKLTRVRARVAELEAHWLDQGDGVQRSAAPSANVRARTRDASGQLFEQAPLPLLGLSRRGRIVRANRQATEALSKRAVQTP